MNITSKQSDKSKGHIIFVNDGFYLGGIEVLELKIARRLIEYGYKVTLACRAHGEFKPEIYGIDHFPHNGLSDFFDRIISMPHSGEKVVLASFHPNSALASLVIAQRARKRLGKDFALFHWVSHSRAFFFSQNPIVLKIMRRAFFELPRSATFFMNLAARDAHAGQWNVNLDEYPVLRIIGREPVSRKTSFAKNDRIRIVSVGRLVPFKAYNANSPIIIRELLDAGLDVEWDIWGYGPDHDLIIEKAAKLNVADRVRMKGRLDHSNFDETVTGYDLFVGMGTAALEAAKVGVPTILALENASDRGYGFLSDVPGDTVGDKVVSISEVKIAKTILEFSRMTESEREKLGRACMEAASNRESELDSFTLEILNRSVARRFSVLDAVWISIFFGYLMLSNWKNYRMKGAIGKLYSVLWSKF